MSRIGRIFLTGLIAALPLLLTIFVVAWLLSLLNQYLGPSSGFGRLLGSLGFGVDASELVSYLIGLGLIVAAIYALGARRAFAAGRLGRRALRPRSSAASRSSPASTTCSSRFVSIVDTKNGDSLKGMSPAWCYFGGKPGAAVLALLPSKTPISSAARTISASSFPPRRCRSAARWSTFRRRGSSPRKAASTS